MAGFMSIDSTRPKVAYFCMEFGLDAALPIYSGGLGILAGDTVKAAGDAEAPLVGVGLFWSRGYTRQTISDKGWPVDAFPETPRGHLEPIDVDVEVEIEGEVVALDAYRVDRELSRGELLLLEPRVVAHRWITERLYGGGGHARIAQEMLLGIGGVRLLRALGREVDVYHFNEGHAVFAGLELLREELAGGATLDEALGAVRRKVVFTTHTPVPAGNEIHSLGELSKLGALLDLGVERAAAIGGDPFSMTAAGLRLARAANAVAELHGETTLKMWAEVEDAAPIVAITNGVHRPTWQDRAVAGAEGEALWRAHAANKRALHDEIERRTGERLDPGGLTVGFARRAATYKRADLILGDELRLAALLEAGVQLIFAGKAHPADQPGKLLVARIAATARRIPGVVFLEDYDMVLGAALTRGCDVWLNNPRRPQEACGTSGMKAAMNGVLNLSILDGWWPEGCRHGETGWRIDAGQFAQKPTQDAADREELYRVLEQEVLPAWRDRDRWLKMMRASIDMSSERFSAARMLRDYYEKLYAS
jgi:starch phosphorylase